MIFYIFHHFMDYESYTGFELAPFVA